MKRIFTLILIGACTGAYAQKLDKLTVETIMRDPKWIGVSPSNIRWSENSRKVYFDWNPEKADLDVLYSITTDNLKPQKVTVTERKNLLPQGGDFNKKRTLRVLDRAGDIWLQNTKTGQLQQLTATADRESNPAFSTDETQVVFQKGDNLFALNLKGGQLSQLTNFVRLAAGAAAPQQGASGRRDGFTGNGSKADVAQAGNLQERWLRDQQNQLFDVLKERARKDKLSAAQRREAQFMLKGPKEIFIAANRSVSGVQASPDLRYITYRVTTAAEGVKTTIVPNYVTASGFTEDIPNRTKVGAPLSTSQTYIYDTGRDTVYNINVTSLPGIKDIPEYMKDYPQQLEDWKKRDADRAVSVSNVSWSDDSRNAVVSIYAQDNKDRWLMKLDATTGNLTLLDRQHDDAWISGPGINSYGSSIGWLDYTHFYFQSEASGYSHIYVADVSTGTQTQLTKGKWEVSNLQLSHDKKTFYFSANMEHPGVSDFYRLPVSGGTPVKLTSMKGGNEVELSPDEKWLAIRYSYVDKPYELYLQANKPGARAVKVTNSISDEFKSYAWRAPKIFSFKNRYGADVYARVYQPANPAPSHPAVIFVHGAGYLQDVMYKWSTSYFREYMFNNMLADAGYTVLEVDYTGSAGYGRDIRTGIYRHMGGRDLTDHVDAVKLLVEQYGVNPKNVGMYGGSYGGFMTLMALFTEPDVFAAGGALRSVTDWAHYNHGYTSNILNEPFNDPKAYQQSSPIYFAKNLKGHLLMCHGMVDQNVNYQDIIRLTQRLIELHKENWELASFPVEDHGFVEPSSWTDEYKRIYKLFNEVLLK